MTAPLAENMKSPLKAWVRALELTAPIDRRQAPTLPVLLGSLATAFGDSPALSSRAVTLSYRELAESIHRYARWARQEGLVPGDVVGLLMPNCPEYLAIWLGLTRAGVVVALLNTNLSGEVLAHSIKIVSPSYVIVGAALSPALRAAREHLPGTVRCWVHGPGDDSLPRVDVEVARLSGEALSDEECPAPALDDKALYIYTSGTTGFL